MHKSIVWILGILLILAVSGMAYFWHASRKSISPSSNASESAQVDELNQKSMASEQPSGVMVEANRNASLDDISAQMKADGSEDSAAIDNEESSETKNANSGTNVMSDLGSSYDESKY